LTNLKEWDPLEESKEEFITLSRKREIKNILKSYTGWFDPFSELIQNALDALDNRREKLGDNFEPTIWIDLDLSKNTLRVTDNGIGFSVDQLYHFLKPSISFKTSGTRRGNKGVGATYLAYGFNHLEIGTKQGEFSFYGIMQNGREWTDDDNNTTPRPKIKETKFPKELFERFDQGSTFSLHFEGKSIRPGNLNWLQVKDAQGWSKILRLTTPLGGIYLQNEVPKTRCYITVTNNDNNKTTEDLKTCEFLYPHIAFQSARLTDIKRKQSDLLERGKDTFRDLPASMRNLNGYYEIWNTSEIGDRNRLNISLSEEERNLVKSYQVTVYGYFSFSTQAWDHYNYQILKLRHGSSGVLKGGLHIATRNMPQGDAITIPLTSSIGYQKTSFVIVHFDSAEPDLGRKGFQPEVVDLSKKLAVSVVNYLKKWHTLLKIDSGSGLDFESGRLVHDWISKHEEHQNLHPLEILNPNFFLPMKEISLLSEPLSEQDVIVLFSQLIAGGVIRGIKILGTHQSLPYDSVCRIVINEPKENHIYHPTLNPLGIDSLNLKILTSKPFVLEYKLNMDALLDEFDKEEKSEKDINIVVCWTAGQKWRERYMIQPLLHPDYLDYRVFHGATHEVRSIQSKGHVCYLVVLSELVEYLNHPEDSKQYQEQTYLSDSE
jgi:hypothetical protein